ncbi:hypothetical protein [Pseudonocardia spinosispora]|uniref:hypothetical protein n=1 Tax=Pseudonocardia spinosispora TaxID=103441 RepID=UPI000400E998|nr:hypothetical protein [Pseudonocardia spinosispora]
MTSLLLTLVVFGLIVYALQRNHERHAPFYDRLYGWVDVEDRDAARFRADLRAARDRQRRTPDAERPTIVAVN